MVGRLKFRHTTVSSFSKPVILSYSFIEDFCALQINDLQQFLKSLTVCNTGMCCTRAWGLHPPSKQDGKLGFLKVIPTRMGHHQRSFIYKRCHTQWKNHLEGGFGYIYLTFKLFRSMSMAFGQDPLSSLLMVSLERRAS